MFRSFFQQASSLCFPKKDWKLLTATDFGNFESEITSGVIRVHINLV